MSWLLKKGFSYILVLILLLAILNIYQLQKTRQQLNQQVSINIKKMALGSIMRDAIRLRTNSIHTMLYTEDFFKRDIEREMLELNAKKYREAREEILALGITREEQELNKKIITQIRIGQPLMYEASDSLFSNEPFEESRKKVITVVKSQQKLFTLLNQLNQLHEKQSDQTLEDIDKNFTYTILLTITVTLVVIILSLSISRRIYRHVINTSNVLANKNKDLVEAYMKAEESTKTKSEFLAKMSHEIRTPINGVMGMLQLLQQTNQDAEQKDFTETALHSSHSLLKVINDILDFSRVEAGKLDIEEIDFSLAHEINNVVSLAAKTAHEKEIEINYLIQPGVSEYYIGDPDRISQVISNLVNNAIKFTDSGEIILDVSLQKKSVNTSRLYFEISDTGIGIPEEVKDELFVSFQQADNSTTRNYGGSGLGLAICKQLVALMGGEIGIKNNKAGGSIFWFTLLLKHSDNTISNTYPATTLKNKNAVIVSNYKIHHSILTPLLQATGLNIDSVKSLSEIPTDKQIDLLLFDSTGITSQDCEQTLPNIQCKKIIYLKHTDKTDSNCYRLSDAQLYKPINPHVLQQALAELFDSQDDNTETVALEKTSRDNIDNRKNILVVDDNSINHKVSVNTLDKLGYKSITANNGQVAIEILKQNPFDLVLMDIEMPVLDGIEATKQLRLMQKENQLPMFPIIALSANAMAGDKEKYIDAGMDDYLSKPFTMEELSLLLDKWLL